jgi:hypothetical protein
MAAGPARYHASLRYIYICPLAAAGIAVIWVFGARSLSMLIDRMHTVTLEARSPDHFLYDNGTLTFGPDILSLMTLEYKYSVTALISASGRVSLVDRAKSFPLGSGRSVPSLTGLPTFEFTADRGDTVRFTRERSLLSWPVFQLNFMTGSSPYMARHVYCCLTWTKRSRANLQLLWRIEQGYYGAGEWRPEKVEIMTSNLLSSMITEASDVDSAAVQYLSRTRQWDRADYTLETRGPSSDSREEVIFALHRDDEHSLHPGAGRSVELRVDYQSRQVMREFSGQ